MDIGIVNKSLKKAKGKFTKIPNFILTDNNLTDGELRTYLIIKSYKYGNGEAYPSYSTIAKGLGKSIKTVSNNVTSLRKKGYIKTKRRRFSGSNKYDFIKEENDQYDIKPMIKNYSSLEQKMTTHNRNYLPPNKTEFNKTESNNFEKISTMGLEKCRDTVRPFRHQK